MNAAYQNEASYDAYDVTDESEDAFYEQRDPDDDLPYMETHDPHSELPPIETPEELMAETEQEGPEDYDDGFDPDGGVEPDNQQLGPDVWDPITPQPEQQPQESPPAVDGRLRYQIRDANLCLVDEGRSAYLAPGEHFARVISIAIEEVDTWARFKTPYYVTRIDRHYIARYGERWEVGLTVHLKHPVFTESIPSETYTVTLEP